MTPPITFVTGASCSGKTTVSNGLIDDPRVMVFDVDQDGTPNAGHVAWLAWRNEELLYEAGNYVHDTKVSCVVTGIIWPHKVVDSMVLRSFPGLDLRFVLLELTKKEMTKRLRDRLSSTDKPLGPYVDYNWDLQARLRQQVEHQVGGTVLRVTSLSPAQVADRVTDLTR